MTTASTVLSDRLVVFGPAAPQVGRPSEPSVRSCSILGPTPPADFCHFAREGVSISGFPYAALPMGPVPDQYQAFLTWAQLSGHADTEAVETSAGPGEVFVSCTEHTDVFSASEGQTLDAVVEQLGSMTGFQLKELSHKEPAWQETPARQRISYAFAARLVGGPKWPDEVCHSDAPR